MTPDLSSRLPSTSTSAGIREERTSKAFSDEHHGPGDARERHSAKGSPWGEMRRCAPGGGPAALLVVGFTEIGFPKNFSSVQFSM